MRRMAARRLGATHHHRRLRYLGEHPPARPAFPEAAEPALHVRVALAFARLLAQVLAAHAELAQVLAPHPGHVRARDDGERRRGEKEQPQEGGAEVGEQAVRRPVQRRLQGVEIEGAPHDRAHEGHLRQAARQLRRPLQAEQPLEARQGVDARQGRRQRLAAHEAARPPHRRRDRRNRDGEEDRQRRQQPGPQHGQALRAHRLVILPL
jgi:hypothetical protein